MAIMFVLRSLFMLLASMAMLTVAEKHLMVIGTFSTHALYTVEYDDEARSLALVANNSVHSASSWLTMSYDHKTLYGTDFKGPDQVFVSYNITDPYNIVQEAELVAGKDCVGSSSIFVNALQDPPHTVYGNFYYGTAWCSSVMAVDEYGRLNHVVQEYVYDTGSAVHGTAITWDGKYMLSADTTGNRIWTHKIDSQTGELSYVDVYNASSEENGPRHISIRPGDKLIYVVYEESSNVGVGTLYENGSVTIDKLYPLLPEGLNPADYWADEVSLAEGANTLWATNRARDNSKKGYITAFKLQRDGTVAEQLFLVETSTSGGFANSVAATKFDDSLAALTDNSTGFVEIWDTTGSVVAHLDIDDGQGCCANAVWLY
ncbi:carboxy-cis,cis-muconate cyclase [Xylariaceae sp. FL1019]|nr:carboxy-cis,cis-muconate cyclase [Xylariaceae sp. FL1019]